MSNGQAGYVPALGYQWLTGLYDPVMRWTMRERTFKELLVQGMRLAPGQRVLDLGCGTATLTLMLKAACPDAEVVGVDGDPAVLALARAKAARAGVSLELDEGLATALPYADSSFDRVCSSLLFHHLPPDAKRHAAAEAWRVLRPGGELHVADWGAPSGALMRLAFLGVQLLDGFATTDENVRGRLADIFREAGFADVRQAGRVNTMFGTLALYAAWRSNGEGARRSERR